jgi:hypothetical protein
VINQKREKGGAGVNFSTNAPNAARPSFEKRNRTAKITNHVDGHIVATTYPKRQSFKDIFNAGLPGRCKK